MPITGTKLRHSWIVLAAFVGALLASGGASASCAMTMDAGACPPVCGCCKAPASNSPTPEAAESVTGHQNIPVHTGEVCPDTPGCVCRSQAPAAPEPKPGQPTSVERSNPGRVAALGWIGFDAAPRLLPFSVSTTAIPSSKLPVYLRNSRLLI